MIKQTIRYTNIDGEPRTRDFWFKISQSEFVKRAMVEGGEAFLEKLQALSKLKPEDMPKGGIQQLMDTFDMMLSAAVGIRDGENLIKSEQIRNDFMFSGAYDAFFMELIQTPDSGGTFMSAVLPGDMAAAIAEANAEREKAGLDPLPTGDTLQAAPPQLAPEGEGKDEEPKWLQESRYPTQKELLNASIDEVRLATKMKQSKAFG